MLTKTKTALKQRIANIPRAGTTDEKFLRDYRILGSAVPKEQSYKTEDHISNSFAHLSLHSPSKDSSPQKTLNLVD